MTVYLENNGSSEHVKKSILIKNTIEDHFGYTVEHIVGREDNDFFLYDENMNELGRFNNIPSIETFEFIIGLSPLYEG